MFEEIDSLNLEIVNVQVLDGYLKNGKIRFGDFFLRDDYKYQMNKFKNLLRSYEDNEKRLSVVDKEEDTDDGYIEEDYTLDDVLETLVADIDIYGLIYDMKEVEIDSGEWELFFETLGAYYIEQDLDGFFMGDMITLNKYAIARSLVYEEECIDLETYIKSLKYLESNIISINNIIEIAERIRETMSIDAVSILANDDGSYGCKNKNSSLFIVDDDIDADKEPVLKEYMEKNGYKVVDAVDVVEHEKIDTSSNVISFDRVKSKRKQKIIDFYKK